MYIGVVLEAPNVVVDIVSELFTPLSAESGVSKPESLLRVIHLLILLVLY